MGDYRITKVICPACKGTGVCEHFDWRCAWCRGEKRMPVAEIDNWSEHWLNFAIGGFIAGDNDLAEMREMKTEVRQVRALAGLPPHPDARPT